MNMAEALCLFVLLLAAVSGAPVMKYSFCSPADERCAPINFASNSTIDFGKNTSEALFYEDDEGERLSVSCTFHEPLRWILTAHEGERVESISSSVTSNGSHLLYYYHIYFTEATNGLIRCESYEDPGLAAEIYAAQRDRFHEYRHLEDRLLEFYPTEVSERGGQLLVPCSMNTFDQNFNLGAIRLQKLRRNFFLVPNLTSECLSCFPQALSDEANFNATSYPYGISPQKWDEVWQTLSGRQRPDCFGDPACVLEILSNGPDFEKLDCNGDVEITCSDHYSAISSYPARCKKSDSNRNFRTIEACIIHEFAQELNSTEADYDPRLGFRLKTEKDMEAVYVCHLQKNLVYLTPYDPRLKIQAQLKITVNNMSDPWTGILCFLPAHSYAEALSDMALEVLTCSSLFACEVQQATVESYVEFRDSNNIEQGESIITYFPELQGQLMKHPPSSGVVKCHATSVFHSDEGYIRELEYFFTGLDSHLYFVSDNFPENAVISLKPVGKELKESDGFEIDVECTIANFVLFPSFQFLVEYSNGTVRTTEQTSKLLRQSAGRSPDEPQYLSQILKQSVNDLDSVVSITCRSPLRNSKDRVHAVLTREALINYSNKEESPENTPSPRADNTSFQDYLVVILIVASCIILLASLTCAVYGVRKYKRSKQMRQLTLEEMNEFWNGNAALAARSSIEVNIDGIGFPECFQIPPTDLRLHTQEILGEGEFGRCMRGDYQDLKVAVKTTKASVDAEAFKDFLREVKIMAYLGKHENIVAFIGAVVNQLRSRICLAVAELSPYGDLLSFLRRSDTETPNNIGQCPNLPTEDRCERPKGTKVGVDNLISFCQQIAAAMEFVVEKKVIHGDLAARNVLVFPNYIVKITDFGLSRKLYTASNYKKKTVTPLPWRWMALESLKYMEFSPMTDMWAYGVTVWEIFTMGQVPFAGLMYSLEFVDEMDGGLRLQRPKNAPEEIFQFTKLTWDRIPSARPSFTDAKNFFGSLSVERY